MIKLVVFDLWRTLAYKDVANDAYTAIARDVLPHSRIGEFKKTFEQVIQTRRWISKAEAYKALLCRLGVESSQASVAMLATAMDSIEAKARLFPHTMPLLCELWEKDIGQRYYQIAASSRLRRSGIEPSYSSILITRSSHMMLALSSQTCQCSKRCWTAQGVSQGKPSWLETAYFMMYFLPSSWGCTLFISPHMSG